MRPADEADLTEIVADAGAHGRRLEICGGGSKAGVGAPREAARLDMTGFTGVVDYDPAELVLTVRAGTPLAEVDALLTASGQMLAFEPYDHGPIFGGPTGRATIGGVVAAGVAGSRRLAMGGARDHLLGFRGVSGRGEAFVGGAKVVKNVTGYDLPKIVAGSWGRLVALTEVTLKVLPRPPVVATLALRDLDAAAATAAMASAMRCPAEVLAAAHLPGTRPLTLLRVAGFAPSVEARLRLLERLLADHAPIRLDAAVEHWAAVRDLRPLDRTLPLWRVNVPPSKGPAIAALAPDDWLFDWAGGLVWLASAADPNAIRAAAAAAGGHAMLVRADPALRAGVPALHPEATGVAALSERVRRAFDPAGVFETGRFLDGADAH